MGIFTTAVTGMATAVDAATLVDKNTSWFKRIINRYLKSTINVLVYGDSGVGKTQFLLTLTGKDSYYAPVRTRELNHYELELRSGRLVRFIDTPGHQSDKKARTSALDDMTKGKIQGIINIVSYGYQDSEDLQKNPDMAFQNGTNVVKPQYLKQNRMLEIERTKEIIERISSNVQLQWFITLVNKADVWNKEREQVMQYYDGEEFRKSMENLEHATRVTICPFCSVITPFGNQDMILSYGERDKKKDFKNLIKALEEFINGHHE